jgi:phenylalanine-4-hydroxylase
VTVETDFAPLYRKLEELPDIAIADILPGDDVISLGTQLYAKGREPAV